MFRILLLLDIILCAYYPGLAQLPDTDIWLLSFSDSAGIPVLKKPVNITLREGYDNQPSFSPDGKFIVYTSVRDTQADIFRYEIKTRKTRQLTFTPESEYSPTFMPDSKHISTVRVERDSVQRLWKFPAEGEVTFSLVMDKVKGVGYHAWLGQDSVALFILGKPFTLQTVNVKRQLPDTVMKNPGRAFAYLPFGRLIFLEKQNSLSFPDTICVYDPKRREIQKKIPALKGAEDFAMVTYDDAKGNPRNALFMCQGSIVYMFWLRGKEEWIRIGDLSSFGIVNITRIAVSPDKKWIAVVSNKKS